VSTPVPPAPSPSPTVTQEAAAAPATTLPRVTLLETEVVPGDGAAAYAATLAVGANGEGAGGVPLVEEPPAPPRPPITREKAALVGKIVGAYVGFGWGVLIADHHDKLAAIADTLMRGHPQLEKLTPEQKWQLGFGLMVKTVEDSAIELAIKYNIHIPYADEGIVGIGVGTATLGVMKAFSGPKNDNQRIRDAKDANPPASPRDMSPNVPRDKRDNAEDNEPVRTARAARATSGGPS
jgi:hypothetical protein